MEKTEYEACRRHVILLTPNKAAGRSLGLRCSWQNTACQRYATIGIFVACLPHAYHTFIFTTPHYALSCLCGVNRILCLRHILNSITLPNIVTSGTRAESVLIFARLTAGFPFQTALALRAFAVCSNRERNGPSSRWS